MRPEKRHALTVAALETLLLAAERVERNHGRYDNPGHPDHWLKKRADAGVTVLWDTSHEANPAMHDGRDWTEAGRRPSVADSHPDRPGPRSPPRPRTRSSSR